MQTSDPVLIEIIRETIRGDGPISFAWFMEQALYHPQHGYYASGRCIIGRDGDYFSNVSVGPVFGRLWARQFAEIWEGLDRPANFKIVEQGAHHGEFAHDALEWLRQKSPDFFSTLKYCIVEPFPALQERQSQTLAGFADKIEWSRSVDHIEPFEGVHFSNELLDSSPVHLLVSRCGTGPDAATACAWHERLVDLQGDDFVFVERPIVEPSLHALVEKLPSRPAGYETEVNSAVLDWIDRIAHKLTRGYVLAVDYGFSREDFYALPHATGTLQCRAAHRLLDSPFAAIGRSDITGHVDWTGLVERAELGGLRLGGFTDQYHFLTGIISEFPELSQDFDSKAKRELQTLLHPEMLGRSFQLLALEKNGGRPRPLAAFKLARDPRVALGL